MNLDTSRNHRLNEVNVLHNKIGGLKQYGCSTTLRFHTVPITYGDIQQTDGLIVNIVNNKRD